MKPMRDLPRKLRRARLLAARCRPIGGINRRGILAGQWDSGSLVRMFMDEPLE